MIPSSVFKEVGSEKSVGCDATENCDIGRVQGVLIYSSGRSGAPVDSVVRVDVAREVDVGLVSVDYQILEVGVSCLLSEKPVSEVTSFLVVRGVERLMSLDVIGAEVEVNAEDSMDGTLRDAEGSFTSTEAGTRRSDSVAHNSEDIGGGSARAMTATARRVKVLVGVLGDSSLDDGPAVLACRSGDGELKGELRG